MKNRRKICKKCKGTGKIRIDKKNELVKLIRCKNCKKG